jgi:flagellar biosynthesis/type III secretory pathway chaperone
MMAQEAAGASGLVPELLGVIDGLVEVLATETEQLAKTGKPAEGNLAANKTKLVLRYETLFQTLASLDPAARAAVPGRERLKPAVERLNGLASANARALDRHIRATQHVLNMVARAARRASQPQFTYGRERIGYGIRSARQSAVAVDRVY